MQRFIILKKFLPGFQLTTLLNQQRFYIVEKLSKTQMAQKAAMNLSFFLRPKLKLKPMDQTQKLTAIIANITLWKKIVRSAHHLFIIPKKFRAPWLAFETEIERRDWNCTDQSKKKCPHISRRRMSKNQRDEKLLYLKNKWWHTTLALVYFPTKFWE